MRPGRKQYDDIVDAITAWHPECRASRIFGMPCVKRSGRVVFGLSRTGMVFKLTDPAAHARALAISGAHIFDPSGRGSQFKQWVVVPLEQAKEWEPLAAEAVAQIFPQGGIPQERNPTAGDPRPVSIRKTRIRPADSGREDP